MIIIGWGKKSKKIADAGIMKCGNCNNYSAFEIRELSSKVSLYFIPIAKWKKKTYLVCALCDAGYELSEKNKEKILQETVKIPDNKTSIELYNKIDSLFVDYAERRKLKAKDMKDWDKFIEKELEKEGYKKEDTGYVLSVYAKSLLDNWKINERKN